MAAAEVVKGHLELSVEEASGRDDKTGVYLWDNIPDAYVKVEIRGGPRNVKVQTKKAIVKAETLTWREKISIEVLEGATELRLMLCREKLQGTRKGTAVIAACGIYVNDILEAVPIDKYFELFKPNAGGEGGLIRIAINFIKLEQNVGAGSTTDISSRAIAGTTVKAEPQDKRKKRGLLFLGIAAAAVAGGLMIAKRK